MDEVRITYKALGELKPYANNPRRNDDAADAVAESIRQFGFKVPIVADRNGEIVAGHTRFKAAKRLGMEKVPVIVADDLTDEQIKAFRLADNKTAELAEWDDELLKLELDAIDMDMDVFGFDDFDIETGEPMAEEDDYEPEPPDEPVSKTGDVYRLGEHILVVGDSTDPEVIESGMDAMEDGAEADLLLTDPPYNIDYEGKTRDALKIDNDAWGDDGSFVDFLTDAFTAAMRRVRQGGGLLRLARQHHCRQLPRGVQTRWDAGSADHHLEQKHLLARAAGLPVEARTVPLRLEGRRGALFHRGPHPFHRLGLPRGLESGEGEEGRTGGIREEGHGGARTRRVGLRQAVEKRAAPHDEAHHAHGPRHREQHAQGANRTGPVRRFRLDADSVRADGPSMRHCRVGPALCGRDNRPMGDVHGRKSGEGELICRSRASSSRT